MVSRIDIGPDGGPYVEIDEDNGDLVIRTPNDNVDFNDEALINIASVAVDSLSTNNDGSIDFNDEDLANISSVATDGVSTNNDVAIDFNSEDLTNIASLSADDVTAPIVRDNNDPENVYETDSVTMDDTEKFNINNNFEGDRGLMIISQTSNEAIGVVAIAGPFGQNVAMVFNGRNAKYATTQGNDGTTNIYHNGSDYILENQLGQRSQYSITFLSDS